MHNVSDNIGPTRPCFIQCPRLHTFDHRDLWYKKRTLFYWAQGDQKIGKIRPIFGKVAKNSCLAK